MKKTRPTTIDALAALAALALCLLLGAGGSPAVAQSGAAPGRAAPTTQDDPVTRFGKAMELERDGKAGSAVDAFHIYLSIPGAEHAAVRAGRGLKAKEFLADLDRLIKDADGPQPRMILVRGDLLLAVGDKPGALACYRQVAGLIAKEPGPAAPGWVQGRMPYDYYPVEPPARGEENIGYGGPGLALPFVLGPGSHRDNWLIRRFLALDAMDEAAAEFARIWKLHQADAEDVKDKQYTGQGLQFAIDYSFFLKKAALAAQGKAGTPAPLDILINPMLRIDMDHNPDFAALRAEPPSAAVGSRGLRAARMRWGWYGATGLSRKEYIRLAFGAFKTEGKQKVLVDALTKQIDGGRNAARRVLARIRLTEGAPDEALDLELAYLQAGRKDGGFDELTMVYRTGLVYEDFKKPPEAAAQYEQALTMPFRPTTMPDADEEMYRSMQASQQGIEFQGSVRFTAQSSFQADLLGRLRRIYSALGQADKVLAISLRQYETNENLLTSEQSLTETARTFKTAGKGDEFLKWAKQRAPTVKDPLARANLYWLLGDKGATTKALVELAKAKRLERYTREPWVSKFASLGKPALRALLMELVEAMPTDGALRLELLDLEDKFEGKDVITVMEVLLNGDTPDVFGRGKYASFNHTQFRDYFDLAYRLMRAYEKAGQLDKLSALGLRIARGEKPFGSPTMSDVNYREENSYPEAANAALALAVSYAKDAKAQDALAEALAKSAWTGARAQLERVRAGAAGSAALAAGKDIMEKPIGWANCPAGVTAVAGSENVLSLARDEKRIFAGHPWGVAVYDFDGNPVTRVALAKAALHLAVCNGGLWVGTADGVDRIDLKTYAVSHLACDNGEYKAARSREKDPRFWRYDAIYGLAANAQTLWIGTGRAICVLNTAANEMRIFSPEELGTESSCDWTRFLFDGQFVWAGNRYVTFRYDSKAEEGAQWKKIREGPGPDRELTMIGLIDGTMWGSIYVNDKLRARPCTIDRQTAALAVTPILIDDPAKAARHEEYCLNGPFRCFGRLGSKDGRLVFGAESWTQFIYEPGPKGEPGKLKPMPGNWDRAKDPIVPLGSSVGFGQPEREEGQPGGTSVFTDIETHQHMIAGLPFHSGAWSVVTLPDGTRVVGGSDDRAPRYVYSDEDWPFAAMVYEMPDGCGGLWFISAEGKVRQVSRPLRSDAILSDVVFGIVPEDANKRMWLCGRYGVAVMDWDNRVVANLTRQDGLLANRVSSGAAVGGKVYFSARWGDHAGGLIVFDPKTGVFTSLTDSDGLASNSLEKIEAKGGVLKLTYGWEYMRSGNGGYRQFPDGQFTPATGEFSPPAAATFNKDPRSSAGREERTPMPILGGHRIGMQDRGNKEYIYGTRGLVIRDVSAKLDLDVAEMDVKLRVDPAIALKAAAKKFQTRQNIPMAEVKELLTNENPYIVANVLASLLTPVSKGQSDYTAIITGFVSNPNRRVRATAIALLSMSKDKAASDGLKAALKDADPHFRAAAALALANRGEFPGWSFFEEILTRGDGGYGNLPFGAESTIGVLVQSHSAYEALAPYADLAGFELLMKYPPYRDNYDNKTKVFPQLGESLRRHPEAVDLLLRAHGEITGHSGSSYYLVQFAQYVFGAAGKDMLPVLHKALASNDRIIRSNAARGCGAVGDQSSIEPLIKAMDLESGLARASIVWAMGELKAKQALPQLARLYVDARNDEQRNRGSGYRAAQAQAAMQAQYETMRNVDSVAADYDELKASTQPATLDPRRDEDLLSPATILDAVRKIGPAVAGDFYRALAGDKESGARYEAATALCEADKADVDRNLAILRNLLADTDARVRMAAAVSLLIMDQDNVRPMILGWLEQGEPWEKSNTLGELARVKDRLPKGSQLDFARKAIQAIAADQAEDHYTRAAATRLLGAGPRPNNRGQE